MFFLVVPIQRECFFFMGVPSSEAVVCFQEALRAELEEEDGMGVGVGVVEMRGNEVRVMQIGQGRIKYFNSLCCFLFPC